MRYGAELFLDKVEKGEILRPAALLTHQAALVEDRMTTLEGFLRKGVSLKRVFFPQHGFFQEKQDNMKESSSFFWKGVPFTSLYGERFAPAPEELEGVEVLYYDLQDVGTRIYTFISTLFLLMESLSGRGIELVILDRPDPLGGVEVEGNLVGKEFLSFVGIDSLPMRYALTPGELARLFLKRHRWDLELRVERVQGWSRGVLFGETGRFWIPPSPNMPSPEAALVYPGAVLLEGTNLSEGRGTTRPFEICGAPYLDADLCAMEMNGLALPGVHFLPYRFTPTFNKGCGESVQGVFWRVTDPKLFRPYRTGLALIRTLRGLAPESFRWALPPYEYEKERLPIDILTGGVEGRLFMEGGEGMEELMEADERLFREERAECLLYPEA